MQRRLRSSGGGFTPRFILGLLVAAVATFVLAPPRRSPVSAGTPETRAFAPRAAVPGCDGDCTGIGQVGVDDILTMVSIALGNAPVVSCEAGDLDDNGQITVDEMLRAVDTALKGCSATTTTPTPTPPRAGLPTPTCVNGARQGVTFINATNYIDIPGATDPTAYSLSLWLRPDGTGDSAIWMRTNGAPAFVFHNMLRIHNGVFQHLTFDPTTERAVSGTTPVLEDTWYHVVITAANADAMRLYVNGVEEGIAVAIATLPTTGDQYHLARAGSPFTHNFVGAIDDVRLYDRVLAADEVATLYNGGGASCAAPVPELGWWPLDEGSGTSVHDRTAHGNDGTIVGAAYWSDAFVCCPHTPTPVALAIPTATSSVGAGLARAVARDIHGVALRLGETVTVDGIVTVAAGVLANKKLKIFMQNDAFGIMVYHQDAGSVSRVFQPGDWLRVTGVLRQADPSGDNQLTGTVMIDISAGSWVLLSGTPMPVPAPRPVSLQDLTRDGIVYAGMLVSLERAQKVAGSWPSVGSQTTAVTISDDGGNTRLSLRLQKNTFASNPQFVSMLNSLANGPFAVVGIAAQNLPSSAGDLLGGFQIWIRGSGDIAPVGP